VTSDFLYGHLHVRSWRNPVAVYADRPAISGSSYRSLPCLSRLMEPTAILADERPLGSHLQGRCGGNSRDTVRPRSTVAGREFARGWGLCRVPFKSFPPSLIATHHRARQHGDRGSLQKVEPDQAVGAEYSLLRNTAPTIFLETSRHSGLLAKLKSASGPVRRDGPCSRLPGFRLARGATSRATIASELPKTSGAIDLRTRETVSNVMLVEPFR